MSIISRKQVEEFASEAATAMSDEVNKLKNKWSERIDLLVASGELDADSAASSKAAIDEGLDSALREMESHMIVEMEELFLKHRTDKPE